MMVLPYWFLLQLSVSTPEPSQKALAESAMAVKALTGRDSRQEAFIVATSHP